jgi:hypothetical protein
MESLSFLLWIVIAYLIAPLAESLVPIVLNKLPLLAQPVVALKRLVVIPILASSRLFRSVRSIQSSLHQTGQGKLSCQLQHTGGTPLF